MMAKDSLNWKARALAAEKTAEVLEKKVRQLYNGDTSAIQRQLERARQRQQANRQRRELMEVRNQELQRYSAKLEAEVAERTRDLRIIVDNVTFGFLVVNQDMRIAPGYTKSCEDLFGCSSLEDRCLADALRVDDDGVLAEMQLAVEQVFDDFLPVELALDQLPSRFEFDGRTIHLEGRAIRAEESGEIQAVLMTVSDVTALEKAQETARENRVLVSLLKQREAFEWFLCDVRGQLERAREAQQSGDEKVVRRLIHTIKGNASSYGLDGVASVIHDVEGTEDLECAALDRVEQAFRDLLDRHHDVLETSFDEAVGDQVRIGAEALQDLERMADSMPPRLAADLRAWTETVLRRPARQVLGPIENFVDELAGRLGKKVSFDLVGGELPVDGERLRPVLQNLVHVIRNAMDHGIEPPDLRGDKPPQGRLCLTIATRGNDYVIAVEDDGRGVDVDRVVAKARERGLDCERLGLADPVDLIFCDGVSTVDAVTEVSGRGAGMSALKGEIDALSGTVTVTSERGRGTRVEVVVPQRSVAPQTAQLGRMRSSVRP